MRTRLSWSPAQVIQISGRLRRIPQLDKYEACTAASSLVLGDVDEVRGIIVLRLSRFPNILLLPTFPGNDWILVREEHLSMVVAVVSGAGADPKAGAPPDEEDVGEGAAVW